MHAAEGILTTRGGMTRHAAVVARGMGKPCVSGAGATARRLRAPARMTVGEHDASSRATSSPSTARPARCWPGACRCVEPELSGEFAHADGLGRRACARMKVRTNADTPPTRAVAAAVRRRRHRPVPHRAHVLRRATASSPCAR